MLKHEVVIGDGEMERAKCDLLTLEVPPTPEHKEKTIHISTQEQEVIHISSQEKEVVHISSQEDIEETCIDQDG